MSDPQQTMKLDLQSLEIALAGGDITGAQEAFAAFKQDLQVAQRAVSPADRASQPDNAVETESGASAVGVSANDGNSAYAKGNRVDVFG
jgi:hypothetical protein